jgi:transforming growth factor-beta-induced protein
MTNKSRQVLKRAALGFGAASAAIATSFAGVAQAQRSVPPLYCSPQFISRFAEECGVSEAAPAEADMGTSIVDVAMDSDDFEILTAALMAADLADVLAGDGPFTVFAPTDAAFAALPEGALETLLLPENIGLLQQILTYHVVPGAVTSDQLASGGVATVEGSDVNVMVGDSVMVDDATVVMADITADNGVIHVIDQVILPPTAMAALEMAMETAMMADEAEMAMEEPEAEMAMEEPEAEMPMAMEEPETPAEEMAMEEPEAEMAMEDSIVDIAVGSDDFEILTAALMAADLVDTLAGEGPFTVFAPTDAAFAALPDGALEALLLPENIGLLQQILTYHVVAGSVTSDQLTAGDVATLEGSEVEIFLGEGVMVNGATVVMADIIASNGVIHVIDQVILPPAVISALESGEISL